MDLEARLDRGLRDGDRIDREKAGQPKERPILMSAPMVRALLTGTKSQTRRLMKPQPEHLQRYEHGRTLYDGTYRRWCWKHTVGADHCDGITQQLGHACPYGVAGDRLWVRETFAYSVKDPEGFNETVGPETHDIVCKEGSHDGEWEHTDEDGKRTMVAPRWKPGIHMPRWASRITLEVTEVRVERLHDITEEDAKAEGVASVAERLSPNTCISQEQTLTTGEPMLASPYRASFAWLWDEINGDRSTWKSNPWVWVVSFRRVEQ